MPNIDLLTDMILDKVEERLRDLDQRFTRRVAALPQPNPSTDTNVEILEQAIEDLRDDLTQAIADAVQTHAAIVASTSQLGHVKPDGTTITIAPDGTITASGGGTGGVPPPPETYSYLVDDNGDYIVDDNGNYLYEVI